MFIIIIGAPGSGKGTVSKLLSEIYKVKHISTGDIFREVISENKEIGEKLAQYVANGLLVPDEIVNKIIKDEINKDENEKGLILDGYPRTIKQAKFLENFLKEKGKKIDKVLKLEIPDEEIIYRTEKRRICSNKECGEIYNIEFKKSKEEGICDKCKCKLVQREDDTKETIKRRLQTYHRRSKSIIEYFEKTGVICEIKLSIKNNITKEQLKKYIEKE